MTIFVPVAFAWLKCKLSVVQKQLLYMYVYTYQLCAAHTNTIKVGRFDLQIAAILDGYQLVVFVTSHVSTTYSAHIVFPEAIHAEPDFFDFKNTVKVICSCL